MTGAEPTLLRTHTSPARALSPRRGTQVYPTSVQALPKANAHDTCAFTAASTHSSRQGLLKRMDITGARWGLARRRGRPHAARRASPTATSTTTGATTSAASTSGSTPAQHKASTYSAPDPYSGKPRPKGLGAAVSQDALCPRRARVPPATCLVPRTRPDVPRGPGHQVGRSGPPGATRSKSSRRASSRSGPSAASHGRSVSVMAASAAWVQARPFSVSTISRARASRGCGVAPRSPWR